MCKQKQIMNECKCSYMELPEIFGFYKPCITLKDLKCVDMVSAKFKFNDCLSDCPLECESTSYELHTSFDEFPNAGLEYRSLKMNPVIQKHFKNSKNISLDDLKAIVGCLYVYFEDLR